ncbi:bifunctional aminoglycoside phosphotransferase/ATP-binding protein [Aliidongia dinghuensis]|nr:bifunctional aminoglycoside phosphotransferase/ATP-binding protein [Aliidongia dinghuensis]
MADEDQTRTIALLGDPATHGGHPVTRVETHASIIFLAGDRAYKLKRAVRYSYLDYSSERLRRIACRDEYALNRRFAPALYLDVRPVTEGDDGRLSLGGDGTPVDWVVVMRRFDEADLFDRMAEAGRLTPDLLVALAERVADVHRAAAPVADQGGAAGIAEAIETTRINLRPGAAFSLAEIASWRRAVDAALAAQRELLERRRLAGKVRECHGDLHLRNICLLDGRPTLFDGIEFSRSIACIDIVFDLAFLLMDLHHRGLDHLGNRVFNRYFDLMDEEDALPLLPLFLSLRAAIRAQVTETAARREPDEALRAAAMAEASAYLALATEALRPERPRLVAVGGFSGTGKTTLARELAPLMLPAPGARVLRSDVIRKRMWDVAETQHLPEGAYGLNNARAVYGRLADETAVTLAAGCSVIADAVFAQPEERRAMAELARRAGVSFHGLWLTAPVETLVARVAGRSGDASDATPAVVRRQVALHIGPLDWETVDAAGDVSMSLASALAAIGVDRPPRA